MGASAALVELEAKLRASHGLTLDESRVLHACRVKSLKEWMYGNVLGGVLGFLATCKLKSLRYNVSFLCGLYYGVNRFRWSRDSLVKDIVAQDGTRMQRELSIILAKKYSTVPWVIPKLFYTENVYDDSTSDQQKLRLRYRSYSGDYVVHGQKTRDLDNDKGSPKNSPGGSNNSLRIDSIAKMTTLVSAQAPVNAGLSTITDPIDDIFGFTETSDESNHVHTSTSSTPTKVHGHRRKRSRHRRHKEASMEPVDE